MTGHAIVNIAWNSRDWKGPPTDEDIDTSSFSYVREHREMHEDVNFDLTTCVKDGWKYGYGFYRGQGAGFTPGGLVFFLSREPDSRGGQSWIVGCYGRAELGQFGLATHPNRGFTVRCPVQHAVAFHAEARLRVDHIRHLQGAKRISQTGINYIGAATARSILDDALVAHRAAGQDTAAIEALLSSLGHTGQHHPVWALGPWKGVTESYLLSLLNWIQRHGAAHSWWSWNFNTRPEALREPMMERGFRLGIAVHGQVHAYYDVAPGGVVDQHSSQGWGDQIPCPWPDLMAPADASLAPDDATKSDKRYCWFRFTSTGLVDPPVPVSSFRNVADGQPAKMTVMGFKFAHPPNSIRTTPYTHDPKLELRVAAWLDGLRNELGERRLQQLGAEEVGNRRRYMPSLQAALTRGDSAADIQRATKKLWSLQNKYTVNARAQFFAADQAQERVLDLVQERSGPAPWAAAIDDFVSWADQHGFRNFHGNHIWSQVGLFASVLLSARHPDRFVDYQPERWRRFAENLGLEESIPDSYGSRLIWAGGLARRISSCPSFRAVFGHDAPLWTLAGLVWALKDGPMAHPQSTAHLERVAALRKKLHDKGQLVLYGPPGTGKTWIARQVAHSEDIVTLTPTERRFFLLVANPEGEDGWHWDQLLQGTDDVESWDASRNYQRHFRSAQPGDLVFGYLAGKKGRCVYTAVEVCTAVEDGPGGPTLEVRRIDGVRAFGTPITLETLRSHDLLGEAAPVRTGMRATMTQLRRAEAEALVELLRAHNPDEAEILGDYLWQDDKHRTTETMTFHPSTAYEDFVEGIRPALAREGDEEDGQVRYELREGHFLALCRRANQHPDKHFYLLIDEINRGNIPAIFGELITLLEKDKRGWMDDPGDDAPAEGRHKMQASLPYSGTAFSVPPNLFVIGTMNTADRSIALIDVALRRRFRFVEVAPDMSLVGAPGPLGGEPSSEPVDDIKEPLARLARALEALNRRIIAQRGRDYRIGHSYFLPLRGAPDAHTFFDQLEELWADEVLPLLAEYFFDDWNHLKEVVGPQVLESVEVDGETVFEGFARLPGEALLLALEKHLVPEPKA